MSALTSDRRFCTLYVGDLLLGVTVDRVDEVLRDPLITPVPLASVDVAGLVNLRGQIITAIDARQRLGLDDNERDISPSIVVTRAGGEIVSLLVDRVGDVVEVNDSNHVEVPVTVGSTLAAVVTGAYKLDRELMLVVDPDEMLTVHSG